MEQKKDKILSILRKFSDMDFQKKVWVKQQFWDEILNFGEAVNILDDYGFFDDVEDGLIRFDEQENQEKLLSFVKELLAYDEPADPEKMLYDSRWRAISLEACEIEKILKSIDF